MEVIRGADAFRDACRSARDGGATVGFVPTMGDLHDGHVSLIERARRGDGFVAVSVFVNPLQFDSPGDLAEYPRRLERDALVAERLFRAAGIEDPVPLFEPLARANLEAAFAAGPGAALTGPAVRGDAGTIRRNAEALQREEPDALSAYVALARLAAAIASAAGRLSEKGRRVVDEELDQWG